MIDIKASKRNGPVIGIVPVTDEDELLMMTSRGKIQRVAAKELSIIGRNTQGVRIMKMDDDDTLTAIVKVPPEDVDESQAILPTSIPLDEVASGDLASSDSVDDAPDATPEEPTTDSPAEE